MRLAAEIEKCRPFFDEPYFARMDVVDDKEGYNSYYIGKRGDMRLEIVDWRAPIARRYYQKSSVRFSINEYDYRVILRRALRVKAGKIDGFKNEFLSVRDYLSREEISGRDEEILFDPYLRENFKIAQGRNERTRYYRNDTGKAVRGDFVAGKGKFRAARVRGQRQNHGDAAPPFLPYV